MKYICSHEQRSMLLFWRVFFTEEAFFVCTFVFFLFSKQRSYSFVFNVYSSVLLFQCYKFSTFNVDFDCQSNQSFRAKKNWEFEKNLLEICARTDTDISLLESLAWGISETHKLSGETKFFWTNQTFFFFIFKWIQPNWRN